MFGSHDLSRSRLVAFAVIVGAGALAAPALAVDCNSNGIDDANEIAANTASDCDGNGVLDSCDIAGGATDANNDGFPDSCVASAPTAILVASVDATCGLSNGSIDISVSDAPIISWSGPSGFSSSSIDLSNLAPGSYTLTASGPGGTASLYVTISAAPDTTAPSASQYTTSHSLSASGISCLAVVPDFSVGLVKSDNCSSGAQIVATQTPAAGSSIGIGSHSATLRLTDASGNFVDLPVSLEVSGSPVAYYPDADNDSYGSAAAAAQNACAPVAGKVTNNSDCNDSRSSARPGAPELCNGQDDDCDGLVDDNVSTFRYYRDDDGDGFGDPTVSLTNCTGVEPDGFVSNNGDCNDSALLYGDVDGDGIGAPPMAGCGVSTSSDNCPTNANSNQANCDSDAQGNACDADDDNDSTADLNDAFPCDAAKFVADSTMSAAQLGAFLATSSGVDVNAAGMTSAQLGAVADNAAGVGASGIKGAFTVASALSASQITTILDRAAPGGLSTVTVDAAGMSPAQLGAVAADIAAVSAVSNLTVTAAVSPTDIAILMTKAASASAVATGMDSDDLNACVSGAGSVTFTGVVHITSGVLSAQISEITSSLGSSASTDLSFDTAGMSGDQISAVNAALASLAAANGGVNPYCNTVDTDTDGAYADACLVNLDDCNDSSNLVHPGAAENCANIAVDNDCDGDTSAAEASDSVDYYTDGDSDGYGAGSATKGCTAPAGKVADNTDCDDSSASVYPGAAELCANLPVDNDCDGSTLESEATDRTTFYADTDMDGAGDPAVSQLRCSQPAGFVANSSDGCPSNGSLTAAITYYADTDGDGFGDPASSAGFCSTTAPNGYAAGAGDGCPSDALKTAPGTCGCGVSDADTDGDGVANCNDGCPNDAAKTAPGACGCGAVDTDSDGDGTANCNDGCPNDPAKTAPGACGCGFVETDYNTNGVTDCLETEPVIVMAASDATLKAGDTLVMRVSASTPQLALGGVQLAVNFDPTRFEAISIDPVTGAVFDTEIGVPDIDNVLGTIKYGVGVGPEAVTGMTSAGALCDITFTVKSAATVCSSSSLVTVVPNIGSFTTGFAAMNGTPVLAILGAGPTLRVDSQAPTFAGVMANASAAADAGTIVGGFVAQPSVTASDDCEASRPVTLSIAYAGGATGTSWPAGSLFPIGVSTVTWSSTDGCGNTATVSRTVTIANHQLLDASVSFVGSMAATSTRQVRVKVGSQTTVESVALTGNTGSITGLQVPVAAGYACVSAKGTVHSLTDAVAPTVSSRRYAASFSMKQGDSNDDDIVDIFDYALFISHRGVTTRDGIANFNADLDVDNGDFSFVGINFLQVGESCSGSFDGPEPRTRISVKELRRRGLADLVVADINRDGWVDLRDIQMYMQGTGMQGTIGAGQIESRTNGTRW